jgi:hypothetical protein
MVLHACVPYCELAATALAPDQTGQQRVSMLGRAVMSTSGLNEPTTGVHSFGGGSKNMMGTLIASLKYKNFSTCLKPHIGADRRVLSKNWRNGLGHLKACR